MVDPHAEQVISVENSQGETLGKATPLDVLANTQRRQLTRDLNPHRYQAIYLAETDFGRLDLYRGLALGVEPAYHRVQL